MGLKNLFGWGNKAEARAASACAAQDSGAVNGKIAVTVQADGCA